MAILFACFAANIVAATSPAIPPPPPRYFTDYAGVVSAAVADELNQRLETNEKDTSSQVLVVIYPELPPGAALEDYTIRAASSWRAGQRAKDNGAILFVFIKNRQMRIEVGYGLEGALPDALAKRIIEDEIKPYFQKGDYAGGLTAGVNAILLATRGEYKGTGHTVAGRNNQGSGWIPILIFVLVLIVLSRIFRRRGTIYSPWGTSSTWGTWGGGWSGGGWSGGGGGFSGGGGRFGGGGASGSW